MPLRNVATTFTIEQQRLEINYLAGDVNNIATGVTAVANATTAVNATNATTAATANALAAGATGADLTLSGTLTVNGSQTILNTATLEVEDKNIIIAKGSTTDAAASGGGITLKGTDDKTLLYDQTGDEWQFNKPLSVVGSQEYASSANDLATSVTKAALRVKGATNSSDSLWMGVETVNAFPYLQGANGVGNNAKNLLLNPFGGNVGVGKVVANANLDIAATNSSSVGTHGFRLGAFGIRTEDVDSYNVWSIEKNYGGWGSAVVLQASGRVGIGTGTAATELDALLTIKGDSNGDSVPSIRLKDGSDSRECWMSNVSGDLYLANGGNDNAYHSRIRLMDGRAIYFDIDGATGSPFSVDANGVYDSKGPIRRIPLQDENSAPYTLVATDAGQMVHAHGSTTSVTVDISTFAPGDAVSIVNGSASDITIVEGSNFTLRNSGDSSTGDRTLSSFGMATIWFSAHNFGYISGAGLS